VTSTIKNVNTNTQHVYSI